MGGSKRTTKATTVALARVPDDVDHFNVVELVDNDEWSGVLLTADFVGQDAENFELHESIARGGRWSGVTLTRFRATDVVFEDCDLSGLVLHEAVMRRVIFRRCRMTGVVLAGSSLHDVQIEECALDEANLRMVEAERVEVLDSNLASADFYAAKLTNVRLDRCDLRGTEFSKMVAKDVDLRGSRLEDLRGADSLRGTTIGADQVVPLARSLAVALHIDVVDP